MKGRRLLMLPVSDHRAASTRYRVLAHLPALEAAGFVPRIRLPLDLDRTALSRPVYRAADMLRDLYAPVEEDLLLVQRKTYVPGPVSRLRREGRRVVFDMDDAVDLPPPGKAAGEAAMGRYRRNFEATVSQADLVLCGNRTLAERVPHDRTELLPTAIDTRRFHPGALTETRAKSLGWVGYSDNLPYLESLAEPLRELSGRHPDLRLIVVADRAPRLEGVRVEYRPWRIENEVSCFEGIGVGLMPLANTPWTRGKCAFKAIQYMALGIPAVASPVGMNAEVIRDGENGFLPRDPAGWVDSIDALLGDASLTASIGEAGLRTVERSYSLDVVSRRLVEILEDLLAIGRL